MALTTGCYLDHHRHSAIVVRVKDGKVVFLTMNVTQRERVAGLRHDVFEVVKQEVSVVTMDDHSFAEQYVVFLPNYPIMKAVKTYWRSGLRVNTEAKEIIRILARNAKAGKIPQQHQG